MVRLTGWRAGAAAFGLGALGAFAHAPYYVWPLLALAVTGFVWLIDGARETAKPRAAGAWRGWCFGFGFFLSGLWWVGSAFIARGPEFAPFAIPGAVSLAAGVALFWLVAGWACAALWRADWRRIFVFALVFGVIEYLRGHILSGFPWNLAGHVWLAGGSMSQSASIWGAYGLSMVTWFAFAAPAALGGPDAQPRARTAAPIAAFVMLALIFAAGLGRITSLAEHERAATGVKLRLVQVQISPEEKWRPDNRERVRERHLALTNRPGLDSRTHVIWSEAALPMLLLDEPQSLERIGAVIGPERILMTGTIRRDLSEPLSPRFYNSFVALDFDPRGNLIAGVYDKTRLVPFGEYIPLEGLLRNLGAPFIGRVAGGYSPGLGKATLEIPGAPDVAPQICYETVFSSYTPRGAERPGWIANVSLDNWYGNTPGPHQAFNQARYRAIEEGVPLVRVATGGVSAVVDAYGRVIARLPLTAEDVLDADLPARARPTLYSLVGDALFFLMLILTGVLAMRSPRKDAAGHTQS